MIHGILFSLYGNCRDKIRALPILRGTWLQNRKYQPDCNIGVSLVRKYANYRTLNLPSLNKIENAHVIIKIFSPG
jgi:hypothetical protein